jgi:hypothetical protein
VGLFPSTWLFVTDSVDELRKLFLDSAGMPALGLAAPSKINSLAMAQAAMTPKRRKSHSENWLENLLVSGSMNGLRYHQQNPL